MELRLKLAQQKKTTVNTCLHIMESIFSHVALFRIAED